MLCMGLSGGFNFVHENVYRFGYGFSHDGAAALVEDGTVVAAIEEERLNRIKHSNKFPEQALRYCLARAKARIEDVDRFAFYLREGCCNNILSRSYLYHEHEQSGALLDSRSLLCDRLGHTFQRDIAPERITFVPHHMAHAVSSFALSGFDRGLILAIDGIGDFLSGIVAVGDGARVEEIKRFHMKKSLGALYFSITRLLGYTYFDEYKVMGLAPYGDPSRYRAPLRALYDLLPEGDYELRLDGVASSLIKHVTPRRKGDPIEQAHKDLAASLQEALEEIVFHVLGHYGHATGHRHLCLAGGVAQNCTMNGRILYSGLFDRVFVQPASHDAGCAVGAALAVATPSPSPRAPRALEHVYWGNDIGDRAAIAAELEKWNGLIASERMRDITRTAAELLADGAVIAWVQGRSEFGPRALGNRSILADPRPAENKDRINKMVKKREAYRPFAPAILEEDVEEYFDIPRHKACFAFMSYVIRVREDKRALLGAVTHVDGTARVQTVSRDTNPRFWSLLDHFKQLTGIPCLLNTSFNNNAEPIVESIEDAIVTCLTTDLDYLVVGDYLVTPCRVDAESLTRLQISLPPYVRMVQHRGFNRTGGAISDCVLTNTYDEGFHLPISDDLYRLLSSLHEHPALALVLNETLANELLQLWQRRLIRVQPSPVAADIS
jgi:carbamoyltransferase